MSGSTRFKPDECVLTFTTASPSSITSLLDHDPSLFSPIAHKIPPVLNKHKIRIIAIAGISLLALSIIGTLYQKVQSVLTLL